MEKPEAIEARIKALIPEKPRSKQSLIDALLPEIETRIKDGVSIKQLAVAMFDDINEQALSVMLRRARIKRDKKTGSAAGAATSLPYRATSARPAGVVAPAGRSSGTKPSLGGARRNASLKTAPLSAEPIGLEGGGGAAAPGEAAASSYPPIEAQDDRIPPPTSSQPVRADMIPPDLAPEILSQCKTWLEVHHYIRILKDPRYKTQTWSRTGLQIVLEREFPDIAEMEV